MKIGIGIDTGGTCTDAIVYHFENKTILASAKTATTKENLSKGIAAALQGLPTEFVKQAEVIALSTTLATNACVENKGGRAKLIFFGVKAENVARTGAEYGLTTEDSLIFIDSKTRPDGQIVKRPDWIRFRRQVKETLRGIEAVGIVEMFAKKSGAPLEKMAKDIIQEELDIPVVCGHELFAENNIVKRGASTLLNAQLISIIAEFMRSVRSVLKSMDIDVPFVIVRSDGSLMTEEFARKHPVETLLCGPVASVRGAMELSREEDAVVVDMGGTTTDVALVKEGVPQNAEAGVQIGNWNTFVKGLFVDTIALGGDSGIRLDENHQICLEDEKVIPFCMAASEFPALKETLYRMQTDKSMLLTQREEIYLGIKEISDGYTDLERGIAQLFYRHPLTLEDAGKHLGQTLLRVHLARLIKEGVLIRCGMTPTDSMHVLGDFAQYDTEAARCGAAKFARIRRESVDSFCRQVYTAVERKLYCNLVRVLLEDRNRKFKDLAKFEPFSAFIADTFDDETKNNDFFLNLHFRTNAALVGVGAPTHVFLPDVGRRLGARVITPMYSKAANALGAIVGGVSAKAVIEVLPNREDGSFILCGCGERRIMTNLQEAEEAAVTVAIEKSRQAACQRGGVEPLAIQVEEKEEIVKTDFGPVFMGYRVSARAKGELCYGVKEKRQVNQEWMKR